MNNTMTEIQGGAADSSCNEQRTTGFAEALKELNSIELAYVGGGTAVVIFE
jgi:hypothetical protein